MNYISRFILGWGETSLNHVASIWRQVKAKFKVNLIYWYKGWNLDLSPGQEQSYSMQVGVEFKMIQTPSYSGGVQFTSFLTKLQFIEARPKFILRTFNSSLD